MRVTCPFIEKTAQQGAEARPLRSVGMSAGFILTLWESCLASVHPFLNLQSGDNDIYLHCYC